jgi:hypothetical protein
VSFIEDLVAANDKVVEASAQRAVEVGDPLCRTELLGGSPPRQSVVRRFIGSAKEPQSHADYHADLAERRRRAIKLFRAVVNADAIRNAKDDQAPRAMPCVVGATCELAGLLPR